MVVSHQNYSVQGVKITRSFSQKKVQDNIVRDLVGSFKLSVKDIKSFVGVSESTIYRWLRQPDDKISWRNYQKLITLYCRCYLQGQCYFLKIEKNNTLEA